MISYLLLNIIILSSCHDLSTLWVNTSILVKTKRWVSSCMIIVIAIFRFNWVSHICNSRCKLPILLTVSHLIRGCIHWTTNNDTIILQSLLLNCKHFVLVRIHITHSIIPTIHGLVCSCSRKRGQVYAISVWGGATRIVNSLASESNWLHLTILMILLILV